MRRPRGRGARGPEPEIRIPRRIQIDVATPAPTVTVTPAIVAHTATLSLPTTQLAPAQTAQTHEERRDRQLADAVGMIKKLELGQMLMANANSKLEAEIAQLRSSFKNMAGECGRELRKMKEEGRVQGHKEVIDEIGALWRSEHFCLELLYGKMSESLFKLLCSTYSICQAPISLRSNTPTYQD